MGYLEQSPAATQDTKAISSFIHRLRKMLKGTKAEITQAEVQQLINLRPTSMVEVLRVSFSSSSPPLRRAVVMMARCLVQIIEECEERLSPIDQQRVLALVNESFPPAPGVRFVQLSDSLVCADEILRCRALHMWGRALRASRYASHVRVPVHDLMSLLDHRPTQARTPNLLRWQCRQRQRTCSLGRTVPKRLLLALGLALVLAPVRASLRALVLLLVPSQPLLALPPVRVQVRDPRAQRKRLQRRRRQLWQR